MRDAQRRHCHEPGLPQGHFNSHEIVQPTIFICLFVILVGALIVGRSLKLRPRRRRVQARRGSRRRHDPRLRSGQRSPPAEGTRQSQSKEFDPEEMAAFLKRRIDPCGHVQRDDPARRLRRASRSSCRPAGHGQAEIEEASVRSPSTGEGQRPEWQTCSARWTWTCRRATTATWSPIRPGTRLGGTEGRSCAKSIPALKDKPELDRCADGQYRKADPKS